MSCKACFSFHSQHKLLDTAHIYLGLTFKHCYMLELFISTDFILGKSWWFEKAKACVILSECAIRTHTRTARTRTTCIYTTKSVRWWSAPRTCPYMHSRSAWTVNKHVNKQLPRVIAHLAVFILFYRRIVEVRVATSVFTQPTDRAVIKNGRHADVCADSPRTPSDDDFYVTHTIADP